MQEVEQKYLNNISKNIKAFRLQKGYSQELLAEKLDCSREFINKVENGKESIGLKSLLKLAIILEKTPQQFFED